ncbi:uncharacterized protein FOMMEDRAFT_151817 [Fomitiporia mediterranea MF3/22]|uniref:uncharacterized protein n=1 Tax=Fomitiporia mediterranea (strain MF3/22) TaxID=694068 RepID=UPI0004409055|nr:uncharacterized protein FOMMEDRAFT_151817 [Fomitiporia mediterranea MF3/22]EJD06545.1 hypothetical protein FOMMEDRAFT_151817 [Fomitiporia mediterranea MF3/22]
MGNTLITDWQSQMQAAESEIVEWENKKKPVDALRDIMKKVNDCIADLNQRIDEIDGADASVSIQVVGRVEVSFTRLEAIANSGYTIADDWGKDMKKAQKLIAERTECKKQAEKGIAYWTDKLTTIQAVATLSEDQPTIGEQEKQILSKFRDIQRKAVARYEEISKRSTRKEYK